MYLTAKERVHKPPVKLFQPCSNFYEFDQLPRELKVSIFAMLDLKSMCCAGNVCKSWLDVSTTGLLWKPLIVTQVLPENTSPWGRKVVKSVIKQKRCFFGL
jgi:hypothetical protein